MKRSSEFCLQTSGERYSEGMKELTLADVRPQRLQITRSDVQPLFLPSISDRVADMVRRGSTPLMKARAQGMLDVANVVNGLQGSSGPYLLGDAALHKLNFLKGRGPRRNPRCLCESPKPSKSYAKSSAKKATFIWSMSKASRSNSKRSSRSPRSRLSKSAQPTEDGPTAKDFGRYRSVPR